MTAAGASVVVGAAVSVVVGAAVTVSVGVAEGVAAAAAAAAAVIVTMDRALHRGQTPRRWRQDWCSVSM